MLNSSRKLINGMTLLFTIMLIALQLISSQVFLFQTIPYLTLHIGLCIVVTFLHMANDTRSGLKRVWCLFLTILAIFMFGYVLLNWQDIQMRAYFNSITDLAVGVCLIILALEATRLGMGAFLPLLSIAVVIYGFLGQYLPEPFRCQSMGLSQTLTNLSIGFEGGIYALLHISANFLFLFILFGGVLNATGASKLFIILGRMVMTRVRGGAAMMAVVASAGVGSITGSAAANVAVTGPITIPLMKKTGFKPHEAAAIEAAASNGGQITPPILGMVAFAMVGLSGIPYLKIVSMSIIPALLYFFTLFLYIYFTASKRNMDVRENIDEEVIDRVEWFFAALKFLVPISVIVILLFSGFSVNYVGFWAIVSTILVSLIHSSARPDFNTFVDGFVQGARQAAVIAASTACVGLILSTLNMSGLGVKLVLGIEAWSQGSLLLSLVLIAAFSVLLGMGGASITSYIIVAVFTVPALSKMGMPVEQGHFFAMFVAVFAFLTPPVALVAMIAAKLAMADYIKTTIEATKAALGGFLLPFLFAYCPLILLQPKDIIFEIFGLAACIMSLIAFEAALTGYFISRCSKLERLWQFLTAVTFLLSIIKGQYLLMFVGVGLFTSFIFLKMHRKRLESVKQSTERLLGKKGLPI